MSSNRTESQREASAPLAAPAAGRRLRALALRRLNLILAALVLVLGVVGYFLFIPVTVTRPEELARLLPTTPLLPNLDTTPAFDGPIPILPNPLPSVNQAANDDPGHTAAYSIQWFGKGQEGANEQLTLYLVPDEATAKELAALEEKQNISAAAMKAANYTLVKHFSVPGLVANGAAYTILRKVQNEQGTPIPIARTNGFTVIARHGRAVVRELAQGPNVTQAQSEALAHQVDGVLAENLPGFPSIASTAYPPAASLYYGLGLAAALAAALLGPGIARRRRAARRAHEADRARYHLRSRGAKNLKRHRRAY